jgi:hypothetical protein
LICVNFPGGVSWASAYLPPGIALQMQSGDQRLGLPDLLVTFRAPLVAFGDPRRPVFPIAGDELEPIAASAGALVA